MRLLAVRHVLFEDLGTFAPACAERGIEIEYHDVVDDSATLGEKAKLADVVVVLGAPIGAADLQDYPFLESEYDLVRQCIADGTPLLGICLGAQIIAAATGGSVEPGVPEIGFAPVELTAAGRDSVLGCLAGQDVLHWHGDRIVPPAEAVVLARTEHTACQAFTLGERVLGIQFHPEADCARIESWLVGHAHEIGSHGIDVGRVRADAGRHQAGLERAGRDVMGRWLGEVLHTSA